VGKPALERKTILDLDEARDDNGISWTICKSRAPHFRQIIMPVPYHSVFTDWILFLLPNQQCQSTEDTNNWPYGDRMGFGFSMQTVLDTTTSFGWTSLDGSMCRTSTPWLSVSRLSTLPCVLLSTSSSSCLMHHTVTKLFITKTKPDLP